tara:strand:+ start:2705 stop:3700 length:996 start_codon:yes stop_codon:yes gene_type:complete
MALWGNKDNVGAAGTVLLNYSTGVVTGAGTSFGIAGGCSEGDVIRVGNRAGTYYGDAVIVSIANSESLTIGSTVGLSGVAVAATTFQVSQLPKYSVLDSSYSEDPDFNREAPSFKVVTTQHVQSASGVSAGSSILPTFASYLEEAGIVAGDFYVDGSVNIPVAGLGTGSIAVDSQSPVGFLTVFFDTTLTPAFGAEFGSGSFYGQDLGKVVSTSSTSVTFTNALTKAAGIGSVVDLNSAYFVSLASTIANTKAQSATLQFGRYMAGYDKYVYGIGSTAAANAQGGQYAVAHAGWVGVTTYLQNDGTLRVKSEVLVAGVGIQTGNTPLYPPS